MTFDDIQNLKIGTTDVSAAYIGTTQVYGGGTTTPPPAPHDYSQDYFTIKSLDNGMGISLHNNEGEYLDGYLQTIEWRAYDVNTSTWSQWDATDTGNITIVEHLKSADFDFDAIFDIYPGTQIQLRVKYAQNMRRARAIRILTTSDYEICGNIGSLLGIPDYDDYYDDNEYIWGGENCDVEDFMGMFSGDTHLIRANNLIFPFEEIGYSGCCEMFKECSNLLSAPQLPARQGYDDCYNSMFSGCTSLTGAPAYIFESQYGLYARACLSMFENCTSLVNAPQLPAFSDGYPDDCYNKMFYNCTSLTGAPASIFDSSSTAPVSGCSEMFAGCTSLVNAPALPATGLGPECYAYMFAGCTSLVNAPALPATGLGDECYAYMFQYCTSLVNAPALPATGLSYFCYHFMFEGCTSLTGAPVLAAETLAEGSYNSMFDSCTSLSSLTCLATSIGENLETCGFLNNVSSTGTFIKNPNATFWTNSDSEWNTGNCMGDGTEYVPLGWTITDYVAP